MEELLHYIWKYRLFQKDLTTTTGELVEVLEVGRPNTDSGPDFFNAKIKVGAEVWVGNIEIHKASDEWYKHRHDSDKAYNSVILHVVEHVNKEVYNQAGQTVPQCRITYPQHIRDNIQYLLSADVAIPCCNYIQTVPSIHMSNWLNALLIDRLERKANDIKRLSERFNNSWDEVFYVLLSRNFGFGLNSESFERLALSLPLRYIQKQADDLAQIEALLFGQAGLLEEKMPDEYSAKMQNEYLFLKNKYSLEPLDATIFMRMRIRPSGSPYIRLAQLAVLIQNIQGLFSRIITAEDVGKIRLMLHQNASEYWQTHYSFGDTSPRKSKYLGDSSLDIILINTIVPILFAYGKTTGSEQLCERALLFLEQIKPESNFITRDFAAAHLKARNAYDSQALIQLKREYCEKRKCLFCRVGHRMLSHKV